MSISGREKEIEMLNLVVQDDKSHFIAVYGRRRVGKTFLIREAFGYRFTFQHSGLAGGSFKEQLFAFSESLKENGLTIKKNPENWLEAFGLLKELVKQSTEKKKIIFIDELSWMSTQKSGLIMALENFWNSFASARKDIILIVCASATSWMLSEIVHNKGGLYNRLTEQIHLQPFTLKECEAYTQSAGLVLNRMQILQYYMIFGGVPYYWEFLEKGQSLFQNVDRILFKNDAPLKEEFAYLYSSVFNQPQDYIRIVEALGKKKAGMTREEIIIATGIPNSGDLTKKLNELESCGFIRKFISFGSKRKNAVYQLVDCFTLFYYKFLVDQPNDEHFWTNQLNTPLMNTWFGLAYERVCLLHLNQIKQSLGISGVLTESNSWSCRADADRGVFGSQIDLLIARKDQVINLCEIKYSESAFTVTGKTDMEIRNKINDLRTVTGTKYAIFPTLITTYGLVTNSYSDSIQSVVTLDALFL